MQQQKVTNWAIFILLSFIWGSSFILMKYSKQELNGIQIGALRIFSAGLIFIPFAVFHLSSIPSKKLPLVILSGILGNLLPSFLFAIAIEKKINSSLAGILNSLTPLFVIVIAVLFFKAKMPAKKIIGVLIGFLGLIMLSLSEGGLSLNNFSYSLLILLATLLYGINVNLVVHYLKELNPVKMGTISLAFMSLPAGIVLWQQNTFSLIHRPSAWPALAASVLLGIAGSAFATVLFYYLIKKAGGLFAAMTTYAIPIVAIFWGVVSKENVTPVQLACLGTILGGVYLTNR